MTGRPIDPAELPETVTRFLAAHRVRDTPTALALFAPDATVTDDGATHTGGADIARWLDRAASEYTYTTELTGARHEGDDRWMATHHLAGDFPGGQVDLRFRFALDGGLISWLTIEP
ncbi:nuclear transport factor 2 family protein [Streptomyces radicis]|uniref:nuclear transport factor 2 family protein n=1 Tax=Streptomyces radicis TaxID=1750517 RepID=UPI00160354B1|nr:nuclear transport factor 2 family protein [Streptomyces radicis]